MPRQKFPSYDEFQGTYNISKAQLRHLHGRGAMESLCTVPAPPRWTSDEFWRVRKEFQDYLARHDILDKHSKRVHAGEPGGDRTLDAYVEDLELLTPEFLRYLQMFLLSNAPLWRILIVDEPGDEIVVYPRVVRINHGLGKGSFDVRFSRLLARIRARRDAREGPLKLLLAHVTTRLRKMLGHESEIPLVSVVCVVDGYCHDLSFETFCILHCASSHLGVERPDEDWECLGPYRWDGDELVLCGQVGTKWYVSFIGLRKDLRGPLVVAWGYGADERTLELGAIEEIRRTKHVRL